MSNVKYNQAKPWQIIMYPLAGTTGTLFLMLMMFSSYVAAGGYGIAIAVAGLVATYSRVFDAVTDPIIGLITTRMSSKYGKARICLVVGLATMILSCLSMFFWCIGTNLVIFTLCYMGYIIGYTIYNVGHTTAQSVLTNDPKQRPKISRYSIIYTTIFSALQSRFLSGYLAPKHGGLNTGLFQELCLIVCAVSVVFVALAVIAIWSKDTKEAYENVSNSPVSFKDMWSVLKSNRAIQTLIVAGASDKLALQTAGNSFVGTMIFGIVIGNYAFNGKLALIILPVQIALVFLATKFAGKHGIKAANVKWTTYSIIAAAVMILYLIVIDPTKISQVTLPTVIFVVLHACCAATQMATSATTGAMIPDCADYELFRSGKYMPAVVGTVYSFVDKLVSSLATTIAALGVSLVGYVSVTPQPGDPSSPAIFAMALFLWKGLPILGWLCTLIAMRWYPLDKDMMDEVKRTNAERIAEKKQKHT